MVRVEQASRPLRGALEVPGDKSIGHRAVILGALARGETRIHNMSAGADNSSTVSAFRRMGVAFRREDGALCIEGRGWDGLQAPRETIDCGNSGTTMRLLAGVLAGRPFAVTLDGDGSLRTRPMKRVTEPLTRMGARMSDREGCAPLGIHGGALHGIEYASPVASAQVKSAVLLAGLQARGETHLEEPYRSRDHTEIMLRGFGARVESVGRAVVVPGGQELSGTRLTVPGDISSAAFLVVAAATILGSDVTVRGVGCNATRSGVIDVLRAMGADIELTGRREEAGEPVADIRVRGGTLTGTEVAPELAPRTIDEYPVLFVAAALAQGTTLFRDVGELRFKESDRIATMARELSRMGARMEVRGDDVAIEGGGSLEAASVESHGDHRVAMALSVAGLSAAGGIRLAGEDCVKVSFPGFFESLEKLRG
ncbi:MAG: 3-phosphoshikimate 1-carboxyvinyltransferase [Deltaproteobacteria bacterium]|nr:3-phosphoshikimate 1-carboxyvinyltransferase [Deltaproteobacteria bacterium]